MTNPIDIEYVHAIARIILCYAPKNAEEVFFEASMHDDGDAAKLMYNYRDDNGTLGWFSVSKAIDGHSIFTNLQRHHMYFKENNLGCWRKLKIHIYVPTGQIRLEFEYAQ